MQVEINQKILTINKKQRQVLKYKTEYEACLQQIHEYQTQVHFKELENRSSGSLVKS